MAHRRPAGGEPVYIAEQDRARSGARDRDRGLLQFREVEEVLEEVPGRRRPGTHLRPDRTGIARPPL